MTVIHRSSPSGHALFCDEVRREDNGKFLHLGVYLTEMVINAPAFPARLPRLSVVVNYYEKVGESTDPVRFVVFLPGEEAPAGEFVLTKPEGPPPPPPPDLEGEEPGPPLFHVGIVLDLQDPVFKQEGRIRVRAFRGEDQIRLGTLRVRLNRTVPAPDARFSDFAKKEKLGPNKFKITFKEMRVPPRVSFRGLPDGATPHVTELSTTSFVVTFEPASIEVEEFAFDLDAEL